MTSLRPFLDFIMRFFLTIVKGKEGRGREEGDRIRKGGKKRKGFDEMSRTGEPNLDSSSMIYI